MVVAIRRRIDVGFELNSYTNTYNYNEIYHKTKTAKYDYGAPGVQVYNLKNFKLKCLRDCSVLYI